MIQDDESIITDQNEGILSRVNSVVTSIKVQLHTLLHFNAIRSFLQNELAYFNLIRFELLSSTPATASRTLMRKMVVVAPSIMPSTAKRQRCVSGLNECSSFLNAIDNYDKTPPPSSVRRRGVLSRYENFGPPLPIDEELWPSTSGTIRLLNIQRSTASSSSGCCSVCCSEAHEQCDVKYAKLEREIANLKCQLAHVTSFPTVILPAKPPSGFRVASLPACGAPPPPPPPLPPADLLRSMNRPLSIKVSATTPTRAKLSRTSSDTTPTLNHSASSPGALNNDTHRQMLRVLKDLKKGRTVLKPVNKSPGGTPRKRALAVYQNSSKTCHDFLTEALKSKFANVHKLQQQSLSASSSLLVGDENEDSFGTNVHQQSFDEDSSWADSPSSAKGRSENDVLNTSRPRIHTVS